MKSGVFLLTALLVSVPVIFGQAGASNPAQNDAQARAERNETSITGCLTKNSANQYELVDQDGVHNLPYSSTIKLDSYVGQAVTLVGRLSPTPTTDMAGPSSPHFEVSQVQPSGKCDIP